MVMSTLALFHAATASTNNCCVAVVLNRRLSKKRIGNECQCACAYRNCYAYISRARSCPDLQAACYGVLMWYDDHHIINQAISRNDESSICCNDGRLFQPPDCYRAGCPAGRHYQLLAVIFCAVTEPTTLTTRGGLYPMGVSYQPPLAAILMLPLPFATAVALSEIHRSLVRQGCRWKNRWQEPTPPNRFLCRTPGCYCGISCNCGVVQPNQVLIGVYTHRAGMQHERQQRLLRRSASVAALRRCGLSEKLTLAQWLTGTTNRQFTAIPGSALDRIYPMYGQAITRSERDVETVVDTVALLYRVLPVAFRLNEPD